MIKGGKITSVEAKREKDEPITGLNININLNELIVSKKNIEIKYTYTVEYLEGVGYLKIMGVLYVEEEEEYANKIKESWENKKGKKLPDEFAEMILNAINYTCGTNGILVVRPLNLSPPMLPPRIGLNKPASVSYPSQTKAG